MLRRTAFPIIFAIQFGLILSIKTIADNWFAEPDLSFVTNRATRIYLESFLRRERLSVLSASCDRLLEKIDSLH